MLSANTPPIFCTRCGWQNEPTARMCGGCGMPLRTTDPGATSNADIVSNWALPATPEPVEATYPPDAPTAYVPQAQQAYTPPAPVITAAPPHRASAGPAAWAGPIPGSRQPDKPARAQARSPWWRVPLIALVVLGVLVGGGLGAWALIIRPALHAQVDGAMHTRLTSAIDQITARIKQSPTGQTLQVSVPVADIERQIQQNVPSGSAISNVHLHFTNDTMSVTYTLNGSTGTITTHLNAYQGRLQALGTTVDYPLGFVESGNEMEDTINAALARLPEGLTVLEIRAANDILTLKVRT